MDLTFFPMDSQLCMLEMESYGYTMADLVYVWHDGINSVEVKNETGVKKHDQQGGQNNFENQRAI